MFWAHGSHVLTLPETGSLSVRFSDRHLELVGYSVSGVLRWPPESDSLEMGLKCVIASSPADAHAPQSARTLALRNASLNGLPSFTICGLRVPSPHPGEDLRPKSGLWTSQHSPWPRAEGTRTSPNLATQVNVIQWNFIFRGSDNHGLRTHTLQRFHFPLGGLISKVSVMVTKSNPAKWLTRGPNQCSDWFLFLLLRRDFDNRFQSWFLLLFF